MRFVILLIIVVVVAVFIEYDDIATWVENNFGGDSSDIADHINDSEDDGDD